jgi:hypothetical protein
MNKGPEQLFAGEGLNEHNGPDKPSPGARAFQFYSAGAVLFERGWERI